MHSVCGCTTRLGFKLLDLLAALPQRMRRVPHTHHKGAVELVRAGASSAIGPAARGATATAAATITTTTTTAIRAAADSSAAAGELQVEGAPLSDRPPAA